MCIPKNYFAFKQTPKKDTFLNIFLLLFMVCITQDFYGDRRGGGNCSGWFDRTAESVEINVDFFFADVAGAFSECGSCWSAKYRDMRSSGISARVSQVNSNPPDYCTRTPRIPFHF